MQNNELKYTCLFGGGGARGFAYCCSIKAMEDLGIQYDIIGGSSVGSVIATLLAVGYNSQEIKDIFMKVNFELFRDIRFGLGKDFALSKGEVFTDWLRTLLAEKVWANNPDKKNCTVTFKDIEKSLVVITTNLSNFKCQEFSKNSTPDYDVAQAVRISCSMPGLMIPTNYDGMTLVDGDLQKSMPMWKLSKTVLKNADRIIEFRLEGDYSGKERNPIDFLNTIYSCMTYVGTEFVSGIFRKNDRYECIKINTRDTIVVDFNMPKKERANLLKIGYDEVMNYFKNFLPLKKRFLLEKYKTLFILLKEFDLSVKSGMVGKSKSGLGEIFIELADCRDNIDERIFTEFMDLKNLFRGSLHKGLLGERISDSKKVNELSSSILDLVSAKIKELESYVAEIK